jgi:hypothetical protein
MCRVFIEDVSPKYKQPFRRNVDRLVESKWLTSIDLKSGFHEIDDESIEKTAFTAWFGNYEWLRLWLKNASAEFCHQMFTVLGDMENVLVYMDEICIHTKTLEDHRRVLVEVFNRLRMS